MRLPANPLVTGLLAAVLVLVALASAASAAFGDYGAVVQKDDDDVVFWADLAVVGSGTAAFSFEDADSDCVVDSDETIFVDLDADGVIDFGELRVTKRGTQSAGELVTSNAGGLGVSVQSNLGGTPPTCSGPLLNSLLIMRALVPTFDASGPDQRLAADEDVALDLDQSGTFTSGDVALSGTSAGNRISTNLDGSSWDVETDCVYTSTASAVDGTATRISPCASGAGGPYAQGSTPTCPGDLDCGRALVLLSDLRHDAANNEYYLSTDATVSNGDKRVTEVSAALERGSSVSCGSDADCTNALGSEIANARVSKSRPLAAWSLLQHDSDGGGGLSAGDGAWMHFGGGAFPEPGDLRMAGHTTGLKFGTKVVPGDADAAHFLTAVVEHVVYHDTNGDGVVDETEQLVLSMDGTVGAPAPGETRLQKEGVCAAGSRVDPDDTCDQTGATWKDAGAAGGVFRYYDADNNNRPSPGDTVYYDVGTASQVDSADLRVTKLGNGAAGERVGVGQTGELGRTLKNLPGGFEVRVLDLDQSGGFSYGDVPVLDADGSGHVSVGDARLMALGTLAFGSIADAGDNDVMHFLTPFGSFRIVIVDADGSGGASLPDPVYVQPGSTAATLGPLDFRVTANAVGDPAGRHLRTDSDAGDTVTLAPAAVFAYSGGGSFGATSKLYVDLNGDGRASVGDVRVSIVDSFDPGSKVRSGDSDEAATLTPVPGPVLAFLDRDGSGGYSGTDPVVLNHDDTAEAALTATPDDPAYTSVADHRLTGTGGATSLPDPSTSTGGPPATTSPPPTTTTPPPTTTPPTDTTTTTPATDTTTSESPTDTETSATDAPLTEAQQRVADANQALQASLRVVRTDEGNLLQWAPQSGVDGYQVHRSTSPYQFIHGTGDAQASTYVDRDGTPESRYIVTAFVEEGGERIGFTTDLDATGALGLDSLEGTSAQEQTTTDDGREPIPGLGIVSIVALAALATVAARRRR